MSDGDRVVGFEIRLKDGVSANARAVEAAIRKTAVETRKAIKAVEEYDAACAAKSTATDNVAAAEQTYRDALAASGAASREAQEAAKGTARAYEELKKATDAVSAAEAKKSMALESAQAAQANVNDLIRKGGSVSEMSARQIQRVGRSLQALATGDIAGAVRALGSLGTKLGVVAIAVGTFWASWKAGLKIIDSIDAFVQKGTISNIGSDISDLSRVIKRHSGELDAVVAKYDGLVARIQKVGQAERAAFNTGTSALGARLEGAFYDSVAGVTDPDEVARKRAEHERLALEREREQADWRRDQTERESQKAVSTLQQKLSALKTEQAAARAIVEQAQDMLGRAVNAHANAASGGTAEKEAEQKVRDAQAQLEKAKADEAKYNGEIAKTEAAIRQQKEASLKAEQEHAVAIARNEAAVKRLESAEKTRKAQAEEAAQKEREAAAAAQRASQERIAAMERESALRQRNRMIAVQAAADMAQLPVLGKDAGAQERIDAAREEIARGSKWQLEPLKAAAEAARVAREEAERKGNAEEIVAAKMKERDANAELLKQEALLKVAGVQRLRELAAREKEAADERVRAAKDALAEEKRRHHHVMGDIEAEKERQAQARQTAKSNAKFEQKKGAALRQLQGLAGAGVDALADDFEIDENGEIQFKHARAQAAFDRLSKKDKAAAALGLQERKAAKEAKAALEKAQKDAQAAAAEQKRANDAALVKIPTVLAKLIGALKAQSQINMGAAENPVNDPTGNILT